MPGQGQEFGSGKGCGCGCGGQAAGKGPAGVCVCSACGHQVPHTPGTPCRDVACSQCGGSMRRGTA